MKNAEFTPHLLREAKRKSQEHSLRGAGFTFIEIVIVLGIFAILMGISFVAIGSFRDDSNLDNDTKNIQAVFRVAQSRTVSSNSDTRYGVYFDTSPSPQQYILFQTDPAADPDYASRVAAEDEVYELSKFVQFSSVDFNPLSGQEVVFDRIQGTTGNDGSVVLQSTKDAGKTRTISVSNGGSIEIGSTSFGDEGNCTDDALPGDRICDSRHVHVTYTGREIMTASETITLNFPNPPSTSFDIVIADNMTGAQINWEGTVNVSGDDQVLQVRTHTINDISAGPVTTVFSIHRDRRFNSEALEITISGDGTGHIIEYNDDGDIINTAGNSIYVADTQEQ